MSESIEKPDKKQSLGVQTIIRYGVQIISHIEEKGLYELKIIDKKLVQDEKKTLSLSVENSGTRMQTPSFTLELIDSQGKKIERFEGIKQKILPTCSVTYQIDLSHVPKGLYKAMAILDHSEKAFFRAKYDIEIK